MKEGKSIMNYTVKLTSEQLEELLELLNAKVSEESEKLENMIAADKITKTPYGIKLDFSGLETAYYELVFDLQQLLKSCDEVK